MRVVVLGASGTWHAQRLGEALAAAGHEAVHVPATRVVARAGEQGATTPTAANRARGGRRLDPVLRPTAGRPAVALDGPDGATLHDADAILVRGVPRGSLEQTIYRLDALHVAEALGVPVLNPARGIERTVDKHLASALVAAAGLPTPPAVACERYEDAMAGFDALGGDVVVKPLFGAMGSGIVRVDDRDVAHRVFRALELERAVFYLQRTVTGDGLRDLRVLVLGGEVVGAIERRAAGWRANVARGATATAAEPTVVEAELALAAARATGADLAGVDLLCAGVEGESPQVIEVNGIPGWQALQRETGIDVAARVVAHVERVVAG